MTMKNGMDRFVPSLLQSLLQNCLHVKIRLIPLKRSPGCLRNFHRLELMSTISQSTIAGSATAVSLMAAQIEKEGKRRRIKLTI